MRKVSTALLIWGALHNVPSLADQIIDQNFCESRALLGKAGAEARDRGVTLKEWKAQLRGLQYSLPQNNYLQKLIPQGLLDVDGVFAGGHKYTPTKVYETLNTTCRDFRGMVLR